MQKGRRSRRCWTGCEACRSRTPILSPWGAAGSPSPLVLAVCCWPASLLIAWSSGKRSKPKKLKQGHIATYHSRVGHARVNKSIPLLCSGTWTAVQLNGLVQLQPPPPRLPPSNFFPPGINSSEMYFFRHIPGSRL